MSPLERFRYIRTLRMPATPKAILWCIASHADAKGLCWPSRPLLAAEAGLSIRAICDGLRWLAQHGLIIRYHRKGRSSTIKLTLDAFAQAATTQAPTALPPRHQLPTEVDQLKARTRNTRKPWTIPCSRCHQLMRSVKPASQALCRPCSLEAKAEAQATAPNVVSLFPESKAKP